MWGHGEGYHLGPRDPGAIPLGGIGGGGFFSPRRPRYVGHHDARRADASVRKSPTKRRLSGTPPPSSPEKLTVIPTPPQTTDTHLLPSLTQPQPSTVMEPRLSLRDLSHEQILKLQADHEGSIIFPNVSPKDLGGWKKKHPQVIESTKIRHEYNFLTGSLVIKCMPMATHDSLQTFFNGTVLLSLSEKFGMSQTLSLVTVGSGTTFTGFKGDWTGSSEKLPDAYVKLPGAEFPSVVCEAGWAEGHEELMNDARLWLLHTDGQTRIVLVVSFTENTLKHSLQAANEEPEEEVRPHGSTSEEETVVDSIDGATNLNDLANNLMDLNRRDKLRQPLVGNLSATLHVYRANEDGRDIVQSFEATLLPQPVVDGGGPKEFGITMEELLGDSVPEGQDPGDRIMFCLENLRDFIRRSIPDTERVRATRRAKKLLRMAGVWEEEETFAQSKRRCRNPPGA